MNKTKEVKLEERAKQYVKLDSSGDVESVNWKGLANLKDRSGYSNHRVFSHIMDNVLDFLQSVGILTLEQESGTFYLTGSGVLGGNVGPAYSVSGIRFNFTRVKDANAYRHLVPRFDGESVCPVGLVSIL